MGHPKVSFDVTRTEYAMIVKIVKRAEKMLGEVYPDIEFDRLNAHRDLCACHANGCPLDLDVLLHADDFNFAHDVFGIMRHMDRKTGKLGGCFLPRMQRDHPCQATVL